MWVYLLPFRDGPVPHSVDRKVLLRLDGIPISTQCLQDNGGLDSFLQTRGKQ